MSWAAHNPELWDEICKKGIVRQIYLELREHGYDFDQTTEWEEALRAVVDVLYQSYDVAALLSSWADKAVGGEVLDHFASIGDAIRMEKEREGS